jgi:hypothetical protein
VTAGTTGTAYNAGNAVNTTTSTNPTMNVVTTATTLLYGAVHGGASAPTSYAAGTNYTLNDSVGVDYGAMSARGQRRTSEVTSGTIQFNFTFGTSDDWCIAAVALAEFTLTVAVAPDNGAHAHSADSPTLTQVHNLTVQNGVHSHVADNVTLVVPAVITQTRFRWRNDDGSETTATWKAAEDTNISLGLDTPVRLRAQVLVEGNTPATAYTLYHKKSTDSVWLPVPVGGVQAVRFTSASSQRYSASSSGISTTARTWAGWVYLTSDRNDFSQFFGLEGGGAWGAVQTAADGTTLNFHTLGGVIAGVAMTVGEWYYVAGARNGTSGVLYWGQEGDTDLSSASGTVGTSTSGTFHVGGNTQTTEYMNGRVAQHRIWSGVVLSEAELLAEMISLSPVRTANLWASYSFKDGPQTNDESGNGHTLTVNNGPMTAEAGPSISPIVITASSNITAGGEATTAQLTEPG